MEGFQEEVTVKVAKPLSPALTLEPLGRTSDAISEPGVPCALLLKGRTSQIQAP